MNRPDRSCAISPIGAGCDAELAKLRRAQTSMKSPLSAGGGEEEGAALGGWMNCTRALRRWASSVVLALPAGVRA